MKVELSSVEWRCLEALMRAIEQGDFETAFRLNESLRQLLKS